MRGSARSATRSGTWGCWEGGGQATTGSGSTRVQPVAVYWDETADPQGWRSLNGDLFRLPAGVPSLDAFERYRADFVPNPDRDPAFDPVKPKNMHCCSTPVIRYQGDLIEATIDERAGRFLGRVGPPLHQLQGARLHRTRLRDVRSDDGRRAPRRRRAARAAREPAGRPLSGPVRADRHRRPRTVSRSPTPPAASGSTRSSSGTTLEREFGGGLFGLVQNVVPVRGVPGRRTSCGTRARPAKTSPRSSGTTPTGGTSDRTCPSDAIEQDLLDRQQFAAVFATTFLDTLGGRDFDAEFGTGIYPEAEIADPAAGRLDDGRARGPGPRAPRG